MGLARNKYWIYEEDITDSTPIQTYVSTQEAISVVSMSYKRIPSTEFVAEAVIESYKSNQ